MEVEFGNPVSDSLPQDPAEPAAVGIDPSLQGDDDGAPSGGLIASSLVSFEVSPKHVAAKSKSKSGGGSKLGVDPALEPEPEPEPEAAGPNCCVGFVRWWQEHRQHKRELANHDVALGMNPFVRHFPRRFLLTFLSLFSRIMALFAPFSLAFLSLLCSRFAHLFRAGADQARAAR